MFQFLLFKVLYAVIAAELHVDASAFVPPVRSKVTPVEPFATKLTRIFSIDCAVNAQPVNAELKEFDERFTQASNKLAWNVARFVHPFHAPTKFVADEPNVIDGNAVSVVA